MTKFEAIASTQAGREVIEADDRRYSAMVRQDWPLLRSLLHDDLVYTHSVGSRDTKESYLANVTENRPIYLDVEIKERFVAGSGDMMTLHGRAVIHVESRGQKMAIDLLYQTVWVRDDGSWQMIGWSSTKTKLDA